MVGADCNSGSGRGLENGGPVSHPFAESDRLRWQNTCQDQSHDRPKQLSAKKQRLHKPNVL
jgi:hypothetical protein